MRVADIGFNGFVVECMTREEFGNGGGEIRRLGLEDEGSGWRMSLVKFCTAAIGNVCGWHPWWALVDRPDWTGTSVCLVSDAKSDWNWGADIRIWGVGVTFVGMNPSGFKRFRCRLAWESVWDMREGVHVKTARMRKHTEISSLLRLSIPDSEALLWFLQKEACRSIWPKAWRRRKRKNSLSSWSC